MTEKNKKIFEYLRDNMFPRRQKLENLYRTFNTCSYDSNNDRYLVTSQISAIYFDALTQWIWKLKSLSKKPQSADTMTFTDQNVVFIEFKTGDPTNHERTKAKLIENVIGKVNDSESTLFQEIISGINDIDESNVKIAFFLVVDAKEMGINSRAAALLQLSMGSSLLHDSRLEYLINELLPDLRKNTNRPDHFDVIDIWYGDIFDTYLAEYGIEDIQRSE